MENELVFENMYTPLMKYCKDLSRLRVEYLSADGETLLAEGHHSYSRGGVYAKDVDGTQFDSLQDNVGDRRHIIPYDRIISWEYVEDQDDSV